MNTRLVGVAVSVAGDTAVPLRAMFRLGLEASDVMETLPVKSPADGGVRVTLNDVLCPGAKVSGVLMPDMLNPVPLAADPEIVTFVPPVFSTVSVWV